MITLAEATRAVEEARAAGGPERLGRALVSWAEVAPVFRYRAGPVRDALVEAGRLLAPLRDDAWEARCLLRLAEARMEEGVLDQARKLADEAGARFDAAGAREGVLRAACLRARLLRRTGDKDEADKLLAAVALDAPAWPDRRATAAGYVALMLALGDEQVDKLSADAIPILRRLLNDLDEARLEAFDARFAAHQGIAVAAELNGRLDTALLHLRAVTQLVKAHDAPMDLVECRLGLGAALAAAKETDEARRVLQSVVDGARDLGAETHRLSALTSLATVLSDKGAVKGAVDLALETVTGWAKQGSTAGYVRGVTLAAHILLAHGREASAIEMLLIGVSSLRRTVGEDAARLLEVQLEALHEQFGEEKYERLCQDILDARAARKRLDRPA